MTFSSIRLGQFTYFSQQLEEPVWSGKNVLDFGGNIGNILRDSNSTIDHERYWCLDVDRESVEQGKTSYPQAHWLFYDRYCFFFNPRGVPNLPLPDLGETFDYIVAFSVFTNTSQTDMLQLVSQLEGILANKGVLAFTFIDPYEFSWGKQRQRNNFQWRLDLEVERGNVSSKNALELDQTAQHATWFTLVNGTDLYIETEDIKAYQPEQQKTYHVFHTAAYMKTLFPRATIVPPVNNEMQHCVIIRKVMKEGDSQILGLR